MEDVASQDSVGLGLLDGALARTVLETWPHCVKILDSDGRLRFVSQNGLCALEVDQLNDVRDRPWAELWPEETQSVVVQAVERAHRGLSTEFEAFCPTARGTPKWWSVRVAPITEGVFSGLILAVSTEITARIQAQKRAAAAERHTDSLRGFVQRVAHDLHEPVRHLLKAGASQDDASARALQGVNSQASALQQVAALLTPSGPETTCLRTTQAATAAVAAWSGNVDAEVAVPERYLHCLFEPLKPQNNGPVVDVAVELSGPWVELTIHRRNARSAAPFTQARLTHLTLARQIAAMHGGQVFVFLDDRQAQGLLLRLPRVPDPSDA